MNASTAAPREPVSARVSRKFTAVSDVDGHSQCSLRAGVENGTVVPAEGSRDDSSSKAALTPRDRRLAAVVHAWDRLQHAIRRVGHRCQAAPGLGEDFPLHDSRRSVGRSAALLTPLIVALAMSGGCRPAEHAVPTLGWQVAATPSLRIGGSQTDPEQQLFQVAGAARLSHGGIVVANRGTGELRFYDGDGRFVRAVGRQGEGPGEFRGLSSLEVGAGDTVRAFDASLGRVSVFGPDDAFVRSVSVPTSTPLSALRRLDDGAWVGFMRAPFNGQTGDMPRDTAEFYRYGPDLRTADPVAAFPGRVWTTLRVGDDRGFRTIAFTPDVLFDVSGNCAYVMRSDEPGVRVLASDGHVVRTFRTPDTRRAVTNDVHSAWLDASLADVPEAARAPLRAALSSMARPDSMPIYSDMVVDVVGDVWLEHYTPPLGPGATWTVLAPDGGVLGTVELPVVLTVLEIGRDYVLGVAKSDVGEATVELHTLERPPAKTPAPAACSSGST